MNKSQSEKTYYWILFIRSKTFWKKFFYGDFSHIAILKNDGFNWIFIDPRPTEVHIEVLPFMGNEEVEEIFKYFAKDLKAVKVYIRKHKKTSVKISNFFIPTILSCVRATKYILGIKTAGVFPIGFYKQLAQAYKMQKYDDNVVVNLIKEYRSN